MTRTNDRQVDQIDPAMVHKIAHLARLALTEAEAEAFSQQLTTIIDHFNLLGEVPVDDVPPATVFHARADTLRADEVQPSLSREAFLALVPQRTGHHVRVAPVFDDKP